MADSAPVDPLDPWASLPNAPALPKARPGKRVRVVLAERRNARRVVRTLAEVEEQTEVGEVLVRQLVHNQLVISLRLGILTLVVLTTLPLMFAVLPVLGTIGVFGLRVPWLVLGVAVYPFLLGIAAYYNRSAERAEQGFVDMVKS